MGIVREQKLQFQKKTINTCVFKQKVVPLQT